MLSSNMLLLNLILLIDVTFSTPTGDVATLRLSFAFCDPTIACREHCNRCKRLPSCLATLVSCRSAHRRATCLHSLHSSGMNTSACRLSPFSRCVRRTVDIPFGCVSWLPDDCYDNFAPTVLSGQSEQRYFGLARAILAEIAGPFQLHSHQLLQELHHSFIRTV